MHIPDGSSAPISDLCAGDTGPKFFTYAHAFSTLFGRKYFRCFVYACTPSDPYPCVHSHTASDVYFYPASANTNAIPGQHSCAATDDISIYALAHELHPVRHA